MRSWRAVCLLVALLSVAGCQERVSGTGEHRQPVQESGTMDTEPIDLEFLTRDGCVNTPELMKNLESAMSMSGNSIRLDVINQASLSVGDSRIGYPTPTILVNGRDLFGLPEPVPPYPEPG